MLIIIVNLSNVDVLIIDVACSAEDLAAFNDEGVARAIFASKIPTIAQLVTNQMYQYRIGWLTQELRPQPLLLQAAINIIWT